MAKIATVNVVEYSGDDLLGVTSFEETEEGNKEAEAHFKQCAKENGAVAHLTADEMDTAEEELDSFVEEGYFEQGTYQLFLTHAHA